MTDNMGFRWKDPRSKSDEEALNTFQYLVSGKANPFRPEVLDFLKDEYESKEEARPSRAVRNLA